MESEHLLKTIRPKEKAWNKAVHYHSKSAGLGLLTWAHFYCPVLRNQIFSALKHWSKEMASLYFSEGGVFPYR